MSLTSVTVQCHCVVSLCCITVSPHCLTELVTPGLAGPGSLPARRLRSALVLLPAANSQNCQELQHTTMRHCHTVTLAHWLISPGLVSSHGITAWISCYLAGGCSSQPGICERVELAGSQVRSHHSSPSLCNSPALPTSL